MVGCTVANHYPIFKRFATHKELPWSSGRCQAASEVLQELAMDTNDEVRRRRLQRLCAAVGGEAGLTQGIRTVAAASDTHWQYLDQVLKKRLLPARRDGTRVPASLGDDVARRIESAYRLKPGWLDWPLDAVSYQAWAGLKEQDQWVVQGRMIEAIEQRAGKIQPEIIHAADENEAGVNLLDDSGQQQTQLGPVVAGKQVGYPESEGSAREEKYAALRDASKYASENDRAPNKRAARPKGGGRA